MNLGSDPLLNFFQSSTPICSKCSHPIKILYTLRTIHAAWPILASSLIRSFWWWFVNGMNYKTPHFEIFSSLLVRVLSELTIYWTVPCLYFSLQVLRTTLSRTTSAFSLQRRPENGGQNNVAQLRAHIVKLCRALSEDLCRKFVTNARVRLQEVVRQNGGHIEHVLH